MTFSHPKKAVLLDLGGVVFQSAGTSNEWIDWPVITGLNERFGHRLNIGEDLFPQFLQKYNASTGLHLTGPEFLSAVFDTLDFNQELVDLLAERFPIVIVSDNYRENIEYLSRRYDFDGWATRQIYSFDYGMVKGDPAFFARVLVELTDYKAEELLLIDDSPEKIASAARHGIHGILYLGVDSVREALATG